MPHSSGQLKFKQGLLSAAVAASVGSSSAFAAKIEEITVSATRRAQSVTEIPYNISAQTGEALEKGGITDFTKLARSVPGLTFIESGPRDSGLNSGLIIRGLNVTTSGSTDLLSVAAPTVSTYVGETPMFVNLILKDIERVEILRGPQGTLYGSGSLGGTIRNILKKPDMGETYGEISTRLNNTTHSSGLNSDTYGVLNLALSDNLALRAVAGYVEDQGFVDVNGLVTFNDQGHILAADGSDPIADGRYAGAVNNGTTYNYIIDIAPGGEKLQPLFHTKADANDSNTKHARISLAWNITDTTNAVFTYQHQEDYAGARQAAQKGTLAHNAHVIEELEREIDLYALDLESDLGFATLSFSASQYENNADYVSDQTPVYVTNDFYAYGYVNAPVDVAYGFYEQRDKGTTAELRLASNGDGAIDYVGGMFWLKQEYSALQQDIMPGAYDFIPAFYGSTPGSWGNPEDRGFFKDETFHQNVSPEYEDKAIFGEVTWHVTDEWQITGGARFFDQSFEVTNELFLLGCGSSCDDPATPTEFTGLGYNVNTSGQSFNDSIFKLNTSYDMTEELMLYFTWAEGFRHGGANAIVENPMSAFYDDPSQKIYKSDLATNWEAGIKGNAFDGILNFTATVFQIDWEDMQFQTLSDGSSIVIIQNAEEAQTRGLEFEGNFYLTENFTARLGLAYVKAELTKDFARPNVQGNAGDKLPGVPELSANLSLEYTQALSSGHELSYRLSANYTDKVQTDFNSNGLNYTETGANTLLDFSMTYTMEALEASLFIDNLSDEQVYGNSRSPNQYANFPYIDPNGSTGGEAFAAYQRTGYYLQSNLNRPRTAGLGLKYKF